MPIPWKRKKDLITCPYWKKDAELFISLCILISYGKDHDPGDTGFYSVDGFRMVNKQTGTEVEFDGIQNQIIWNEK